jgi:hypothetical protein
VDSERQFGVRTAERFFRELRLKSSGGDLRYRLVENFILLSSPNKANVQRAMGTFLEVGFPTLKIDYRSIIDFSREFPFF